MKRQWRWKPGLAVILLATIGAPVLPVRATNHASDCPGRIPSLPAVPNYQLNERMSRWDQKGVEFTLTCWYDTTTTITPQLVVTVIYYAQLPPGGKKLEGTCGPVDPPWKINSPSKQVKADWGGHQFAHGKPLAEMLIQRMEGRAVTCQQAVLLVACDEWDVRLEDDRKTDWRGNWKRAPGAFGYTAIWERLAHEPGRAAPMPTGEFIPRALFVKPGDALQFVSEDPGGVVITYYSRPFSGRPGAVEGDYEMTGPYGTSSGSWWARCVDPGPFQRTWTPPRLDEIRRRRP